MMLIVSVFVFFVMFEMLLKARENKGSYGMQMMLSVVAMSSLPVIIGLFIKMGYNKENKSSCFRRKN